MNQTVAKSIRRKVRREHFKVGENNPAKFKLLCRAYKKKWIRTSKNKRNRLNI